MSVGHEVADQFGLFSSERQYAVALLPVTHDEWQMHLVSIDECHCRIDMQALELIGCGDEDIVHIGRVASRYDVRAVYLVYLVAEVERFGFGQQVVFAVAYPVAFALIDLPFAKACRLHHFCQSVWVESYAL